MLALLSQAAMALDACGLLTLSVPRYRTPERSLVRRASFSLGAPGTRLLPGLCMWKHPVMANTCPTIQGYSYSSTQI